MTRICLEEAVAALKRAELTAASGGGVHEALSRAHSIALWLCRAVSTDNPLSDALVAFYGGLAAIIRRNMAQPKLDELTQVRIDFEDLLQASKG